MDPILVADDHPLFRSALKQAVADAFPQAPLIEADSLAAIETVLTPPRSWHLVVMDLNMPGTHGLSGLIWLRQQLPDTPLAVISASETRDVVDKCIRLGANGFIPKSAPLEQLSEALRRIATGETWSPHPEATTGIVTASASEQEISQRVASLTPQQFRVLGMLLEGMANKVIAAELGVSEATVKAHMTVIFRKLGVRNRTQAVLLLRDITALEAPPEEPAG